MTMMVLLLMLLMSMAMLKHNSHEDGIEDGEGLDHGDDGNGNGDGDGDDDEEREPRFRGSSVGDSRMSVQRP